MSQIKSLFLYKIDPLRFHKEKNNMRSQFVCWIVVFAALCTVARGSDESSESNENRQHSSADSQEVAKLKIIADLVSYVFSQEGSAKVLQEMLKHRTSSGQIPFSGDNGSFKLILQHMKSFPSNRQCTMERKLQYGSTIITAISGGICGSGGKDTFQFERYITSINYSSVRNQGLRSNQIVQYTTSRVLQAGTREYVTDAFRTLWIEIGYSPSNGSGSSSEHGGRSSSHGSHSSSSSSSSGSSEETKGPHSGERHPNSGERGTHSHSREHRTRRG